MQERTYSDIAEKIAGNISFESLLPEDVRSRLENGDDIFGILDVSDISNHIF